MAKGSTSHTASAPAPAPAAKGATAPAVAGTPAAPETEADKAARRAARKAKKNKNKIDFPGIGAPTGYPFETMPTDFNFGTHKPLTKKNFKDSAGFTEYRAAQFKFRGERMLTLSKKLSDSVALERQFGSEDLRKKAKKYAAMQAEMENIRKLLAESGIDPATLNAPTPEAAAQA